MAANKTSKRTPKASNKAKAEGRTGGALRQKGDPRTERRYLPRVSKLSALYLVTGGLGCALLGAALTGLRLEAGRGEEGKSTGLFALDFQKAIEGPTQAAPYLAIIAFALVVVSIAIAFSGRLPKPVRVGDAGIALEKGGADIVRIAWRDVTRVVLGPEALTFESSGGSISIPVFAQPQAAARALAEARTRIPKRVEKVGGAKLAEPDDEAGELIQLEVPQVAGARCKASDKLITFERDARVCGVCGEVYHKDHIPQSCLSCEAHFE